MFQFICLSLCIYVPPLTEYFFFRGFGYGPFRHCWDGHKHKKLTSVTNPREAGILGSYIPHFFENGLTFLSRIFCKTVPGVTTLQKITVWHSLLGVILGYFWAHFTVCSNISWEAFNIFSRNFIQMFLVYTNGYYTIFFFVSCPPATHSGVRFSVSWESFNICSWNFLSMFSALIWWSRH